MPINFHCHHRKAGIKLTIPNRRAVADFERDRVKRLWSREDLDKLRAMDMYRSGIACSLECSRYQCV